MLSAHIVLIITALILVICVIVGGLRGFIKTFFAAFSVFIALFAAVQAGPYLGKVIQHTPIYSVISSQIEEKLDEQSEARAEKVSRQIEEINGYPIPQILKDALIENNNNQIYEALGVYDFNAYVACYMACLILNAIAFLIVFLAAFIVLKIIETSLDLISKLPVLHSINALGGILCGAVHGLIVVWILGIVLAVFSWTGIGQIASAEINANPILGIIYNNNLILSALTNMSKLLF